VDASVEHGDKHGHEHGHEHGSPRTSWLLLVPVLAMLLVLPPPLGADSVLADARLAGGPPRDRSAFPPLPAGAVVPLSMSDVVSRAAWDGGSLDHRVVRLRGFAVRAGGSIELARLVITCCAADATPMAVRLTGGRSVADGAWFEVTGTIVAGSSTSADEYVPTLTVRTMRPITTPVDPYEH
ncbi:MAG: TIGR03943 family protein, partial [Sciscionella sp.]|nr:TIGR03943 family protein [Sciscionella sp.]